MLNSVAAYKNWLFVYAVKQWRNQGFTYKNCYWSPPTFRIHGNKYFSLPTLLPLLRFLVCLMLELLWKIWTFCLQGVAYECDCTFWCVLCQCIEKYWKICDFKTNLANRNYDVGIYVRDHWNPQLVEQQGLLLLVL